MASSVPVQHVYEVRPRKDRRGFDLISDALPFGRLWYDDAESAASYAAFYSRSRAVVVHIFNQAGELIETREHKGDFREGS
jgi:hypothetical protein